MVKRLPVENGGIASRDFIYVEDMARGLMNCALLGEPGEIYNLASGVEISILELGQSGECYWRKQDTYCADTSARLGTDRVNVSATPARPARSSALPQNVRPRRRPQADDRLDPAKTINGSSVCMRNHIAHVSEVGKYS